MIVCKSCFDQNFIIAKKQLWVCVKCLFTLFCKQFFLVDNKKVIIFLTTVILNKVDCNKNILVGFIIEFELFT